MYEMLWYFFLYAFIGWCVEVAFAALKNGEFVNRGFLNGPYCPIYGVGMVLVIGLLQPLRDNILLLFLGSVVLTSALEWVTGFILEKAFQQKWWDYSAMPFNLNGYICLLFSLIWGLACLLILEVFHPLIAALVGIIPQTLGHILLALLLAVIALDVVATVRSVLRLNRQLAQIDALAAKIKQLSNELGAGISDEAIELAEKYSARKEQYEEQHQEKLQRREERWQAFASALEERKQEAAEAQQKRRAEREEAQARLKHELAELKTRQQEKLNESRRSHKRLLDAFPALRSTRYNESLQQLRQAWQERRQKKENPPPTAEQDGQDEQAAQQ